LSLGLKPPLTESEGGNRQKERIREIYIDREGDGKGEGKGRDVTSDTYPSTTKAKLVKLSH
jgi:hypothetical protein